MKKLLLLGLFLFNCDENIFDNNECCSDSANSLDIYDVWKQNNPLEQDSNGYYHFGYNPTGQSDSDYGTVKYITEQPTTRVFWTSPDSFFVEYMGQLIGQPIINNSTYSDGEGYGQQLFYIYSDFIGDTLTIYGSINASIIDTVFVIVK